MNEITLKYALDSKDDFYAKLFETLEMYKHTTEPINELNNMEATMDYITSQESAVEVIKDGYYMVGSISPNTYSISFSLRPRLHISEASARAECKRLSRDNVGTMYTFVQFKGAEMVPTNTLSI